RLAQRGRLLLDPTGIGQDQGCPIHQPDELRIRRGLDQVDVRMPREDPSHRLLDIRVEVDWVEKDDVGKTAAEIGDRQADLEEALAEVLASVPRDEDHAVVTEHGILSAPALAVSASAP